MGRTVNRLRRYSVLLDDRFMAQLRIGVLTAARARFSAALTTSEAWTAFCANAPAREFAEIVQNVFDSLLAEADVKTIKPRDSRAHNAEGAGEKGSGQLEVVEWAARIIARVTSLGVVLERTGQVQPSQGGKHERSGAGPGQEAKPLSSAAHGAASSSSSLSTSSSSSSPSTSAASYLPSPTEAGGAVDSSDVGAQVQLRFGPGPGLPDSRVVSFVLDREPNSEPKSVKVSDTEHMPSTAVFIR